jgi:hypothetical protein
MTSQKNLLKFIVPPYKTSNSIMEIHRFQIMKDMKHNEHMQIIVKDRKTKRPDILLLPFVTATLSDCEEHMIRCIKSVKEREYRVRKQNDYNWYAGIILSVNTASIFVTPSKPEFPSNIELVELGLHCVDFDDFFYLLQEESQNEHYNTRRQNKIQRNIAPLRLS